MKKAARLAVLALASLATSSLGQVPVMFPEFQVNVPPPGYGYGSDIINGVAIGADGRFTTTFASPYPGSVGRPLRRSFDVQGNPASLPLSVSSASDGWLSDIARDASGRYVTVWTGNDEKIWVRRFAADGTPLGDQFQISSSISSGAPHVASDPSGDFVVTWTTGGPSWTDAKARLFDSFGAPRGGEIPVAAFTTGNQAAGGAGMAANGRFVVWWTGNGSRGGGTYVRIFDPSGAPVTGDIRVSSHIASDMSMDAAGRMVFVWGGATGVAGLRVDATGAPSGPVIPVDDGPTYSGARVASNSGGNFLVTWGSGDSSARFFDPSGGAAGPTFQVNQGGHYDGYHWTLDARPSLADNGSFVVAWTSEWYCCLGYTRTNVNARTSAVRASYGIQVGFGAQQSESPLSRVGQTNDVLEPGETVLVASAWENLSSSPVAISGTAPFFTGPAGATYTLVDGTADYGVVGAGQGGSCYTAGDCYAVAVSAPGLRPAQHWDAQLQENLNIGVPKTWTLHIGESFPDVPTSNSFYTFVETVFHNGITAGCFGGGYCPDNTVTRAQMAVFLLKAKFGAAHVPPACSGTVFSDVTCAGVFDPWIEELSTLGITGGCGGGLYCPGNAVTREQMAAFLLKTALGADYEPPSCGGFFADMACTPGAGFADWAEDLYSRHVTGGCDTSPLRYCPTDPNTRGQMAAFLTKTFALALYGGR